MDNIRTKINQKRREKNLYLPKTIASKNGSLEGVSQFLQAQNPVAIFTNAIGDLIMTLPALRALSALFPERLTIICPDWASDIISVNLPQFGNVIGPELWQKMFGIDPMFQTDLNNGTVSESLRLEFETNGIRLSQNIVVFVIENSQHWRIADKDLGQSYNIVKEAGKLEIFGVKISEYVGKRINQCDLFLSLNPWHSAEIDRLLKVLAPTDSIGFFPAYSKQLPWLEKPDQRRHSIDIAFNVPRYLDSSLRPENFANPLVLPSDCQQVARRWRNAVPTPLRVLTVHADTKSQKMWPDDRFVQLLDIFLDKHPDFIVMVVGSQDLKLNRGQYGDRIYPCYGQRLEVSLALVGEADLFLGVDSCMLHAADLFRVPGVGLFGPTSSEEFGFRFAPHCHVSGEGTMETISVDEVINALEWLIEQE